MTRWRSSISVLIALALGTASAWFIGRTAGTGGVFVTALGSAASTWAITRHRTPGPRRAIWTAVYSIIAETLLWTTVSIVSYARADGVSLDVGFYYMANAGGRLLGTVLSVISSTGSMMPWPMSFFHRRLAMTVVKRGLSLLVIHEA